MQPSLRMGALNNLIAIFPVHISKLKTALPMIISNVLVFNTKNCRGYFNLESYPLLYQLPLISAFMLPLHNHDLGKPEITTLAIKKRFTQDCEELSVRKGLRR